MKAMLKPMLLIAATLAAAVCIVFCSALFWVKSNHGLQWVQSRINAEIPGKITIETHRLSLLVPGLDLYGIALHDPKGLTLAGLAHLSVELDWRALWRREIRIKRVLLQGPWTDLAVDEAAGINLMTALVPPSREKETEAPAPDGPGLPFNIVCESIQLTDGRFTLTPSDGTTHLEATGLALSVRGDLMARSVSLELTVDRLGFSSAGIHPGPARIALRAHLNGDKLSIPALDVTSGRATMRLSGSAESLYTSPWVDGVLSVDGRLEELKAVFNLAGDYTGPVDAKLTLKGTVANPDARLVMTLGNGLIAGQPVDRGDLSIDLKDRQVRIDRAALRRADGLVVLNGTVNLRDSFPTGFLAPPADANAIAYALDLVQDIPDLEPWFKPFIDISGKMAGRISLTGNGIMPQSGISAQLTMTGSGQGLLAPGMAQPIDADVNLSARMDRGTISLSRLNATADGIELSGDGRFQLNDRALAGKLSLTADDLSRALAVVGIPSVSGACRASLSVDGNLNRPQFSVDLTSKNLKVDTYAIGDLVVEANMDHDGRLNLTTLNVQNRDSRIHGNGRLRLLPGSGGIDPEFANTLALTMETLSAADFMESPPINGTIDGRLQVGGPPGSLTGELSLKATALSTDAVTVGEVDARMRLNAGTVLVDRLQLRNRDSTIDAAGSIQLLAPGTLSLVDDPPVDFTADSDHLDPGDFIDAASGDFTFTAELKGSLEKPEGRFTLNGRQANLAGQAVETFTLDTRLTDRRLWLDRLIAVVAHDERIEGTGWVGLDKTMDLRVKSDGISVTRIDRLHGFFPGEGVLRFDVTGKGSLLNPDIDGILRVSDIIINDGGIEDINLSFSLHDMLARITGNLNFEMDATCDLNKGDFESHLTFNRTETAAYFKAAGQKDFSGSLTGRITAKGNIREVADMTSDIALSQLHLNYQATPLIRSDRIAARLENRTLTIPRIELALLSEGSLALNGDVRIGGAMNMAIDGRLPFAAGKAFSETLDGATGMLALTGTLSGNAANPQIDARVDMERIGMTIPGLTQKLRDLNGRVTLTGNRIRIDGVKGYLDSGSFQIDGTLEHDHFRPGRVNLTLAARSLPLEIPETLMVLLNGDITITDKDRTAEARGTIVLLEGLYEKDVKISLLDVTSAATNRQRTVEPARKPISIPWYDKVNLDIAVSHRQPFSIENNLAQLEISPDLGIGGSLATPVLSGRAQIREGRVFFQKKTFEVQKGIIDFVNPYRTEAEIDIQSQLEIRTWRINLALKGTPDNLAITLTSDPSETPSDILSLILFGQTSRELAEGEGVAQRTTGQIMAEMVADTFGVDIKRTTGLDILQVEAAESDDKNGAGEVKVTMGKHLSDRMTVKYAVETKDGETIQRAITEYKLLEHILVSGFQDNRGIYGSELAFRIEFR